MKFGKRAAVGNQMGQALLKFQNRLNQDWCLGPTHEEVITDYVKKDIKSYRDLPKILYQIQTKYRDEIRPRFGLMRGREFIMKDAYSFDRDKKSALSSYKKMYRVYSNIFSRLGVRFCVVKADSGDIGGELSQEFHILAESGEDEILVGENYAANVEICPALDTEPHSSKEKALEKEKFKTPDLRTIEDLSKALNIPPRFLVKTMFFSASSSELKPFAVLLRGSDQVSLLKLKKALGLKEEPLMLKDEEIRKLTSASPGSCGPVGLNIDVYMDQGVESLKNYVVGANEDDFHLKNVNHGRDFSAKGIYDLRQAREGDKNPEGPGLLKSFRGIEVGHIFYLGTKYSEAMSAQYLDSSGKAQAIEMGCYGVGITRVVQAVIEQSHDEDGIIWPLALAPYEVHVCLLDPQKPKALSLCEKLEEALKEKGASLWIDDREERPGVKFKDADLLGMPLRINIGARGLEKGELEVVVRKTKEVIKMAPDQLVSPCVEAFRRGPILVDFL